MAPADKRCERGLLPGPCNEQHLKPLLTPARGKNFRCPLHPEHVKFSINPGTAQRIVFCCNDGKCHESELNALRQAIEDLGGGDSCLGNYGKRKPAPSTWQPVRLAPLPPDPRIAKWEAVYALPTNLNGSLYRMCVQAIKELPDDAKPTGDPWELLSSEPKPFYALAERSGLGNYKYNLFKTFIAM